MIDHDGQGYFLCDWITVGDDAGTVGVVETDDLNERQKWILARLHRGASVRRADVEKKFGVVAKTAQRDLAELNARWLTTYVREGRSGVYRMGR